jgi:signal peptidase I
VAVFYSPHDGTRLVKRVAGVPGDTVELRNNHLILNGQEVRYEPLDRDVLRDVAPEELAASRYAQEDLPGGAHAVASIPGRRAARDFGPFKVPDGQYFMMGDNRDDSFDSRYFGAVPRDRFLGRASAVALSVDRENFWLPRWHRFCTSLDR